MIPRLIEKPILDALQTSNKLVLVYGPRQAGKTTLLNHIKDALPKSEPAILTLNCDLDEERSAINTTAITPLNQLLTNKTHLFIDEAQRLDNPGLTLKIIHDNFPGLQVLATGSSSFQLKNSVSDAMTGRYLDFTLSPLSFTEIIEFQKLSDNPSLRKKQADTFLAGLLLYGSYPDVYRESLVVQKQQLLARITESYLFRDILAFQKVRYSQTIVDLAKALSYQLGSEVNDHELANRLKIDRKTVISYLDILEQAFVIKRLHPFSKKPRREIGRKYKVYFLDLGIRNSLIGDFNPLELRADLGALWENFLIIERLKAYANANKPLAHYNFWRSYGGAEVDYIEKPFDSALRAFEFKYGSAGLSRGAGTFTEEYKTSVSVINKENYLEFIT